MLARCCRDIDRMDADCFADDAILTYAPLFHGMVREFIDWIWSVYRDMVSDSHVISNVVCEVDGSTAASEAYSRSTLVERQPIRPVGGGVRLDACQPRSV